MHVMLARAELTGNRPEQAIVELRKALLPIRVMWTHTTIFG
jgi:hypothetical protein